MTGRPVSLVIVNYATMDRAVGLAAGLVPQLHQVIVVDNASFAGDRSLMEEQHRAVRFVWSDQNRGYGAGANAGTAVATGEVLVVANPDLEVTGEAIEELAGAAGNGLAAPRFVVPDGSLIRSSHRREPVFLSTINEYCGPFAALMQRVRPGWHPTLRPALDHNADHPTLHVLGALMAVDAGLFRQIGGFDEGFFLYREETDLCRRVRGAGRTVRHVASVAVVHEGDASSPGAGFAVAVRPTAVASHYRYIAKHYGRWRAALCWLAGLAGSGLWFLTGRDRRSAAESVRSHLRTAAGRRR